MGFFFGISECVCGRFGPYIVVLMGVLDVLSVFCVCLMSFWCCNFQRFPSISSCF